MTNIEKFNVTREARRNARFHGGDAIGAFRAFAHRSSRRGFRLRLRASVAEYLAGGEWDFDPTPPSRRAVIDGWDTL